MYDYYLNGPHHISDFFFVFFAPNTLSHVDDREHAENLNNVYNRAQEHKQQQATS